MEKAMKRITLRFLSVVMVAVICLSVISCGSKYRIDDKDKSWVLVMISRNFDSEVVYASAEYKLVYDDAELLDLTLKAADGKIVITDRKMGMQYFGSYEDKKLEDEKASYSISFIENGEAKTGYANITGAKLHNGTLEYTLILVFKDYTVYFKSR